MNNFEKRKDRFEFFETFESPALNLTCEIECPNFLPYCKEKGLPVFHFFLYCVTETLRQSENFQYRIVDGKVSKMDSLFISYTVMNEIGLFNFTKFERVLNRAEFIKTSIANASKSSKTNELVNTGHELKESELKKFVFITSLPWLKFTSIQHPAFKLKSSDIPSLAWGKFEVLDEKTLTMPFSVQAHHGFVDGIHVHEFFETLKQVVKDNINL